MRCFAPFVSRLLEGAMASIFHGCRNGWSAEKTLSWAKPLGLQYLSNPAMVDWVSGCVQARAPKGGLIFRCHRSAINLVGSLRDKSWGC